MDQVEFNNFNDRNPCCAEIFPYLLCERENALNVKYNILDNNFLTDLAKIARNNCDEFKILMQEKEQEIFIIPQMVFEESFRNFANLGVQKVNEIYLDFYKIMKSLGIKIYIESLSYNFKLFSEGFTNSTVAFDQFKTLSKESTNNIEIQKLIEDAKSIEDIEIYYRLNLKDAGERFIFLFAHSMMMDEVSSIDILSNEIKGVYNVWIANREKSNLLKVMFNNFPDKYYHKLHVISYNKFLVDVLINLNIIPQDFLIVVRDKNIENRKIKYSHNLHNIVDDKIISNANFINLFCHNGGYKIAF